LSFLFTLLFALFAATSTLAQDAPVEGVREALTDVPLPRPRPPEAPSATIEIDPVFAAEPREASACQMRMVADQIANIEVLPSITGPADCGAIDLVKLKEIVLSDKTRVTVIPAPTLRCEMAEAVTNWVREDVVTEISKLGSTLQALDNYDSYECRGRNRIVGARTSEHGRGNALDVRGMKLANGKFVDLTDRNVGRDFREAIKASICNRFSTVLGPHSDGYHETHIHMDLAERRNNYKLCQWAVLDPLPAVPLPRPRPKEAPAAQDAPGEE
jgi:hypothetical protein